MGCGAAVQSGFHRVQHLHKVARIITNHTVQVGYQLQLQQLGRHEWGLLVTLMLSGHSGWLPSSPASP
ncbi:hypothetical protein BS78_09G037900 [Paspalum vaginatum]|nr:hypothetical protein BS78_09G037900 [Paspalum vaginatum]